MRRVVLLIASLLAALWATPLSAAPACRKATFEGDGFVVCRYDPAHDILRLAARGPTGPLDSLQGLRAFLGGDAARVRFALNGGMYQPDQSPVGLYVAGGRTEAALNRAAGTGNFFLKPNGVFWTGADGAPHVDESEAFAAAAPAAQWATQSGPLLVSRGVLHPAIAPNGTSLTVRDAVGVKGRLALFVVSDGPVSFGRLARFVRDGLGCPDVLYLDGHVASLWSPTLKRQDGRTGLGTFVVVLRRGR
ncbi:phosphodiester glycosidase family protein [Caulobacter sp. KR2-114]|uniref:phosphodiester glycosidase family protein n=1 Tax=Caulobacter sp. KR2-114 TaxID=3400912 RepID=UPI003BFC1E45